MNTLAKLVTETIDQLEAQNQPQPVKLELEWVSDAERLGLPLVNEHDDKGAPVLDRDKALAKSLPDYVGLR